MRDDGRSALPLSDAVCACATQSPLDSQSGFDSFDFEQVSKVKVGVVGNHDIGSEPLLDNDTLHLDGGAGRSGPSPRGDGVILTVSGDGTGHVDDTCDVWSAAEYGSSRNRQKLLVGTTNARAGYDCAIDTVGSGVSDIPIMSTRVVCVCMFRF